MAVAKTDLVLVERGGVAYKTTAGDVAELSGIKSDPTGITGASAILNEVRLSQASFDAIVTPDPDTKYVIV